MAILDSEFAYITTIGLKPWLYCLLLKDTLLHASPLLEFMMPTDPSRGEKVYALLSMKISDLQVVLAEWRSIGRLCKSTSLACSPSPLSELMWSLQTDLQPRGTGTASLCAWIENFPSLSSSATPEFHTASKYPTRCAYRLIADFLRLTKSRVPRWITASRRSATLVAGAGWLCSCRTDQHKSTQRNAALRPRAARRTMTTAPTTIGNPSPSNAIITIGVLALQGAFVEHVTLLHQAAASLHTSSPHIGNNVTFAFTQVRTPTDLAQCHALILPGGESTSIALIAQRTGLLEPLREFVKVLRRPVWGTCAGLIMLAERANRTKATGQDLIGGLDVSVQRNYFGRQVESFEADLDLPFLGETATPFPSVFIRAPVVEKVLDKSSAQVVDCTEDGATVAAPALARKATAAPVEILGRLPGRAVALRDQTTTAEDLGEDGDIVAVRQDHVFGTAFHPELTGDARIHAWWLKEVVKAVSLA